MEPRRHGVLEGWPDYREGGVPYSTLGEFDGDTSRLEVHAAYFGTGNHAVLSHGNGDRFPGWPIPGDGRYASAAEDLDGDGIDEIIAGNVFHTDATLAPFEGFNWDSPGVADIDGDEVPEIISASNASILVHTSRGELVPGWPYFDPTVVGTSSQQTVSMGDVDGDGGTEMVILSRGNTNPPWLASLSIFANDGHLKRSVMLAHTFSYMSPPVLADLDADGIPEIIAQMNDAVYAFDGDGSVLPGWPVSLPPTSMRNFAPIVGDLDGNPGPEIVVLATAPVLTTGTEGVLHVYSAQGVELFTKSLPQLWSGLTPAIADIDLDGRNDLVLAMTGGTGVARSIFAYTFSSGPTGPIEWGQYREGPKHHSYYPLGKNLPTVAFLSVHADGNGSVTSNDGGINCGADCIQRYNKGANVTLTATPPPGGIFRGWRGACSGTAPTCVVGVARNRSVIADFTTRELSVSFIGQGAGRLVSSPAGIDCGACTASFPPNTYVTLTPVPDDASYFDGWLITGDCAGNAPTCTVKMDRARSVTAIFRTKSVLTVELIGTRPRPRRLLARRDRLHGSEVYGGIHT